MSRVKRGVFSRKSRKKVLRMASGYTGRNSICYTVAKQKVEKAMQYQYRDRRTFKRDIRSLWIVRINAAVREFGMRYSTFMAAATRAGITLNRKMLAYVAAQNPDQFKQIVEKVSKQG